MISQLLPLSARSYTAFGTTADCVSDAVAGASESWQSRSPADSPLPSRLESMLTTCDQLSSTCTRWTARGATYLLDPGVDVPPDENPSVLASKPSSIPTPATSDHFPLSTNSVPRSVISREMAYFHATRVLARISALERDLLDLSDDSDDIGLRAGPLLPPYSTTLAATLASHPSGLDELPYSAPRLPLSLTVFSCNRSTCNDQYLPARHIAVPVAAVWSLASKGVVLVASRDISSGTVVAIERPIVSVHGPLKSFALVDRLCHNCSALLRSAQSHTDETTSVSKHGRRQGDAWVCRSCPASSIDAVIFCSAACVDYAVENYHSAQCSGSLVAWYRQVVAATSGGGRPGASADVASSIDLAARVLAKAATVAATSPEAIGHVLSIVQCHVANWVPDVGPELAFYFDIYAHFLKCFPAIALYAVDTAPVMEAFLKELPPPGDRVAQSLLLGAGHRSDSSELRICFAMFLRIISVSLSNATGLGRRSPTLGLYAFHASMNHSCAPSCQVTRVLEDDRSALHCPEQGPGLKISALRDIAAGEELTHCYLPNDITSMPWAQRIRTLQHHWQFECRCLRCSYESSVVRQLQVVLRDTLPGYTATTPTAAARDLYRRGTEYHNTGNFTAALESWVAAAEAGDQSAMYAAGVAFAGGDDFGLVPRDVHRGISLLLQAAIGVHPDSTAAWEALHQLLDTTDQDEAVGRFSNCEDLRYWLGVAVSIGKGTHQNI